MGLLIELLLTLPLHKEEIRMPLHELSGHGRLVRATKRLNEHELLAEQDGKQIERIGHHGSRCHHDAGALLGPDDARVQPVRKHLYRHELVLQVGLNHQVRTTLYERSLLRDEKTAVLIYEWFKLLQLLPVSAR